MSQREWQSSTAIIEKAVAILEDENPMTIRQLFYRLVSVQRETNETVAATIKQMMVTT